MKILTDIGGTYARFARGQDNQPADIRKYKAADFPDLQSALQRYCEDINVSIGGDLLIATAAHENADGLWVFVNKNKWIIDPQTLEAQGWSVQTILNDFEAATWSLLSRDHQDVQTLKDSAKNQGNKTLCLLGPGTGLGLGYLHASNPPYVQKTNGGHMPIASLNDAHGKAIKRMREETGAAVVFETFVSGPGLQKLREQYDEATALELFHEFLGIFAASSVISGHAYGGVFLTGGVVTSLMEEGLFDITIFERSFCFAAVPSISEALQQTPIYVLRDPYPALKGLLNAA